MPSKFRNKYKINSSRLQNYDYSQNGMYFITICTKEKEYFFGDIESGEMKLNDMGKIIQEELLKTPIIRKNVFLDEWIIMPNHLHMIIEINNESNNNDASRRDASRRDALRRDASRRDASRRDASQCVSTTTTEYKNKFGPQINNLASIIRGFKGITTKRAHMCDFDFQWQSNYYDHIIRSDESLNKIREYIIANPEMWDRDKNNDVENIWM